MLYCFCFFVVAQKFLFRRDGRPFSHTVDLHFDQQLQLHSLGNVYLNLNDFVLAFLLIAFSAAIVWLVWVCVECDFYWGGIHLSCRVKGKLWPEFGNIEIIRMWILLGKRQSLFKRIALRNFSAGRCLGYWKLSQSVKYFQYQCDYWTGFSLCYSFFIQQQLIELHSTRDCLLPDNYHRTGKHTLYKISNG